MNLSAANQTLIQKSAAFDPHYDEPGPANYGKKVPDNMSKSTKRRILEPGGEITGIKTRNAQHEGAPTFPSAMILTRFAV